MEAKYDFAKKYRDQILKCSRCGYCQAVCPAYGATLRPALNARGKMLILKEVMDGELDLSKAYGVGVGAYDKWAIRYGYAQFGPGANEREALRAIIGDGLRAAYLFVSDPDARRRELEDQLRQYLSPFRTAEAFGIEEIIDPRDTRKLLCEWIETAYDLLPAELGPKRRACRP